MTKTIVISQSMYFPWCGLLDQVRLADIFVHYDDVQFARGFFNRVQVKTSQGVAWLSVPLSDRHRGQLIDEILICYEENWISKHRAIIKSSCKKAPYINDALRIFDEVVETRHENLGQLGRASIIAVAAYLGIDKGTQFINSRNLGIGGSGSQRLMDITKQLNGTIYLTGHGALNYLDHELFEANNIEVRYMKYKIKEYQQFYGLFTPYLTCLDAIAHLGPEATSILQSSTLNWRKSIERPEELRA